MRSARRRFFLHPTLCLSALTLALLLVGIQVASGFVIQTAEGASEPVQWSWRGRGDRIPFLIDSAGSDDLSPETTFQILRESFRVWEQVRTSEAGFLDQGLTSTRVPSSRDGVNLLAFDETGSWLSAPSGTGVIAVTRINADANTGQLLDADIIFNGRDFRFLEGFSASSLRVNLKEVAIHEIGHLLGLDHSSLDRPAEVRPTMHPFYGGDGAGNGHTLEPDDMAGVSVLYPTSAFLGAEGVVSGRVADLSDAPVFGGNLVAENLDTGELFGTLSGAYPGSGDPGHYILRGLTPGPYRLSLGPLSGGITEEHFGGIFSGFTTGFPEEFYDNEERSNQAQIIPLSAGQHLGDIDFVTGFVRPGHPVIAPLSEPANTPDVLGPYAVLVRVTDASEVVLVYRIGTGDTSARVPMDEREPEVYEGVIPGQPAGTPVSYRIEAQDEEGAASFFPGEDGWLDFEIVSVTGAPLAFTAVREEGVVSVIDTGDESELARIPVGADPVQVLLAPDGGAVYVASLGASEVTVIETATFRILDRLTVAAQPLDMAVSADGRTIYVTNSGASSLTAIEIASGRVTTLPLDGVGTGPYGVAAAGDGQGIYVTDITNGMVVALDAAGRVLQRIPVADQPRSLAAGADRRRLFVTSFSSSVLTIIDAVRNQVSTTVDLPASGSFAAAVSPNGRRLYVTAHGDAAVLILDVDRETVLKSVPVGADPRGVCFSPAGDRAFVTSSASNTVHVIDTAAEEVVGTYRPGNGPRGIALVPAPGASTPTEVASGLPLPSDIALHPTCPNPFNAATRITYSLPQAAAGHVQLGVYNLGGQVMRVLIDEQEGGGVYQAQWDGRDASGRRAASGVYLVRLRAPGGQRTQRMLLLR